MRKTQHKLIKKRLSSVNKVLEPLLQKWENQVLHFQKFCDRDSNYSNLNYRDFLVQWLRLLPMQGQVPSLIRELDHTFYAAQPKRIFFFIYISV